MEIKGNIGEEVRIKGVIEEININAEGVRYIVKIDGFEPKSFKEDVLLFAEKAVARKSEITEAIKRGPGRPRKITVDDLVKKCIKED